jgi:hypothetical protein
LERAREFQVPLNDTPAQSAVKLSRLSGEAEADLAGKEIHVRAPAQSVSIFAVN